MSSAVTGLAGTTDLLCEHFSRPLGVETLRPGLSWRIVGSGRGLRQGAYRILVASSPEKLAADVGDLWDTGRVQSDQSLHVPYAGTPLRSRQRCYWKVAVWDHKGAGGAFSKPASWEMGLLNASDWKGNWIANGQGYLQTNEGPHCAPMFRKAFMLPDRPLAARAYVCGLGYHELSINGKRIGDAVLEPAPTRFDRRSLYVVHDVTDAFVKGANAVGVMLGTGLYDCHTQEVWDFRTAPWRDRPKMLFQLHVDLADGSTWQLVSDGSWKVTSGPITFNGLRNGESYDACLEKPDWSVAVCDDSAWAPVAIIPGPGGELRWEKLPPCRVTQTLRPVAITQPKPGMYIVDMGQSFAGWGRIRVRGKAGDTVVLRYAEKLTADGALDPSNINMFVKTGPFQTDQYTLKGQGQEQWEPRFTYHGFRYVEITGWPGTPSLEDIDGRVIHTDFAPVGAFECSNALLNKIQTAARWSTVSNYHGVPTDCPHREKCGWTGDASLSAEQVLLNYAAATAYAKWMDDIADVQRPNGQVPGIAPTGGWGFNWGSGPAWDSALTHVPWYVYLYTGDPSVLEAQYEHMKRLVDFTSTMATNDTVTFGLGDWCPPGSDPNGHPCPTAVTSTGYYYAGASLVAQAAKMLGKADDAARYAELAARIKKAWQKKFFDAAAGQVTSNSQTANSAGLFFGLIDAADAPRVLQALITDIDARDGHGFFGILGAKYVLQALTDAGRADVAYRIASKDTFPSWGLWIRQGATSLWEKWDGSSSRLHHVFSDISAWFYKALAGINPDPQQPGFKRVILQPYPVGDLKWVKGEHRSLYGALRVQWRREGSKFRYEIELPPNTSALVHLPTSEASAITESGRPAAKAAGVHPAGTASGRAVFEVESGQYVFETAMA